MTVHERLVEITRAVIEEAADRGNAVILGRGGAFILAHRPDALHVQLHASLDARVRYLLARVEEIPAEARPEEKRCASCARRSTRPGPSTSRQVCSAPTGST